MAPQKYSFNINRFAIPIFAMLQTGLSLCPEIVEGQGGKSGQHRVTHRLMAGPAPGGKRVPQKITVSPKAR